MSNGIEDLHQLLECAHAQYEGHYVPPLSPCTLTTQAPYAGCRSDEGHTDYECRLSTLERSEAPRLMEQPRIEDIKVYTPSSCAQTEERTTPVERHTMQMAESRAYAAWKGPCR